MSTITFPGLSTTSLIDRLIESSSPVAIGVAAFETLAYLKKHEHQGPVILIHSDLGRVEQKDSLPTCQRLADRLRLSLVVVRRSKGGISEAKRKAAERSRVASRIPTHLLFTKNWPHVLPTRAEAILLGEVRRSVAEIMGFPIQDSEPDQIINRYAELMALHEQRGVMVEPSRLLPVQQQLWSLEEAV